MKRLSRVFQTTVCASALALSAGFAATASAQHLNDFASGPANVKLAKKNIDVPVESRLADKIQDIFASGKYDEQFSSMFDESVVVAVRAAYAQNLFEPIWTGPGAESLRQAQQTMRDNGMEPGLSDESLEKLLKQRFSGWKSERAEADLKLTMVWLAYASQMRDGLSDFGSVATAGEDAPARSSLIVDIQNAGFGDANDLLTSYEPAHEQYQGLKNTLSSYMTLEQQGGWKEISTGGDPIELNAVDDRVPELRRRLIAEGYYSLPSFDQLVDIMAVSNLETDDPKLTEDLRVMQVELETWAKTYDESLEAAVKRFQAHHGLADDGVVGRGTYAALNESATSKVSRIKSSLQKWREIGNVEGRMVWANIPSYRAEGWNDNVSEISMRTVVGMRSRQTPIFSDEIEYAVTNPRWYAPVSIVRKDKLPKLAADPSYASRKGFNIYDRATGERVSAASVDWTDASAASNYQLVQGSGAANALGKLKIIFPNKDAIYLHGTPTKYLFDRPQRAYSSGCIRLEDPTSMAAWLAGGDTAVTPEEIEASVNSGKRQRFDFDQKVPVNLTYITVTIGDDGKAEFWPDVYNKEAPVETNLQVAEALDIAPADTNSDDAGSEYADLKVDQPQRAG